MDNVLNVCLIKYINLVNVHVNKFIMLLNVNKIHIVLGLIINVLIKFVLQYNHNMIVAQILIVCGHFNKILVCNSQIVILYHH